MRECHTCRDQQRPFVGQLIVQSTCRVLIFDCRLLFLRSLYQSGPRALGQGSHIQVKVSSTLTISLAEVSKNPQPLDLAHSQPDLLLTARASFKSHLLPATDITGGVLQPSSRPPLTRVPLSWSKMLFSSIRFSASMLIVSKNHDKNPRELEFVMS